MSAPANKLATVEECLARASEPQRAALERLRRIIRQTAPEAQECVSYQMAAFRQNGLLVALGATAKHCAFYLMSGTMVEAHEAELKEWETSKGTIRFQPSHPLPEELVVKLVEARLKENLDLTKRRNNKA